MKKLLKICAAGVLLSSAMIQVASAGTEQKQSVVSPAGLQGMDAMKDVQFARLALFRGEPDAARNLVIEAKKSLKGSRIGNQPSHYPKRKHRRLVIFT